MSNRKSKAKNPKLQKQDSDQEYEYQMNEQQHSPEYMQAFYLGVAYGQVQWKKIFWQFNRHLKFDTECSQMTDRGSIYPKDLSNHTFFIFYPSNIFRPQKSTNPESATRARRNRPVKTLNEDFIYKAHYEQHYKENDYRNGEEEKIVEQKGEAFLNPKIQCLLHKRIRKFNPNSKERKKIGGHNLKTQNGVKTKKMQLEGLEQSDQEQKESKSELNDSPQDFETLQNNEDEQFLVKFEGKSYLRVKWMTRDEIYDEVGIELTPGMIKSMNLKIKKLQALKLGKDQCFNPNFLQADRILSSTQIFTAIHHKKANQIKGKWDESIMLVCSKLLNFMKDGYPYGVHFHEPYVQNMEEELKISNQTNLGQIINRIYLSQFKGYEQFWKELGRAIRLYFKVFPENKGDNHRVGITVKQASIFLYEQWYHMCKERFNTVRNELIDTNVIQGEKIANIKEDYNEDSPQTPQVDQNYEQLDINQFTKTNVFLTDKIVQTPKNKEQLELLNPGQFSFVWLQPQQVQKNIVDLSYSDKKYYNLEDKTEEQNKKSPLKKINEKYLNYQYQQLDIEDMKSLDLNIQVDKLYLVKWKDLSYAQSTWQTETLLNNSDKILEFKNWNKIPNRQTRERVQIHNKIHKFLLTFYEQPDNRIIKNPNINKMEKKLYLLDGLGKEPRQYGGKDIPIFKNYRMLKEFQLQSLNWLIKNWYENRNCILADEMGLGKTIQTISFLYHLHTYENVLGPFLVLAPLTTLPQWRRQIQQWTEFNCLLYYDEGSTTAREIIQNYEFFHLHTTKNGDIIPSKIPKFQVLLVNYELFINDFEILKKIPFQHVILDEAHRLKNKRSNTTKVLSLLPCCRKTLLTGTPIQNNTKELFTLLNFIEPHNFPSEDLFVLKFGNLNTQDEVKEFKKMLKPYLLRRVKQDVEKTIPKLYEMIIDVEMTKKQKQVYRGLLEKNKNEMIKGLSTANFNSLAIQLRKCCNHPFLISPQLEEQIIKQFGSNPHQAFLKASGKIILLMKLLKKFKNEGKKVLVFSQFVIMLDLLKDFLDAQKFNVEVLKGSLSGTIRHQAITRFNQDPNTDIFLISTKAGGVGINLISASQIVIYDSDWNPQNDIQATARAHRIGQKKEVTVYRLITANTYEAEMFQISSKKLGLDKAVFNGQCFKNSGQFNQAEKQMSKDEIEMLLKKGILGFLQNQKNQDEYFNQSIEDILEKNARRVEFVGNQATAYSKTKFISQEGQNDISIDAPDFWERALKNVQTPIDKLCKKSNNLKDYQVPQKQQELMIEAYNLIYEFVRNKTVGTGFNNEDERQLTKFLQEVSGERKFMRKYRDIANTLLEQIEKPSRRFRVKYEELLLNPNSSVPNKIPEKKNRIIRPTRTNKLDDDLQLAYEDDLDEVYSGVSQNDKESGEKQSNEKESNQKESNGLESNMGENGKYLQEIQKLCFSCHKPKCSIFCAGICGRSYHKVCYEKILNNEDEIAKNQEIDEIAYSFDQWKEKIQTEEKCPICLSDNNTYFLACAQCGHEGKYSPRNQKPPRKDRKAKITDYIQKNENQDDQLLFKCTVAKCNNFYHLSCLYKKEYQNKFAYSSGKTVQDVQNPPPSTNVKLFRCPSHYCKKCYGTDEAVFTTRTSKCFKCPKSYHQRPKCMPSSKLIKIMRNVYLCPEHLSEINKTQAALKEEYKPFKDFFDGSLGETFNKESLKKKKIKEKESKVNDEELQEEEQKPLQKTVKKKTQQNGQGQNEKVVKKKKPKAPIKLKFSYLDIGLTPVLSFDYQRYNDNWCRYCGSRYAKSFQQGPWGKNTLCKHHNELWKAKRITIPEVENPTEPIHRDKETEIKFLNEYMSLHPNIKVTELLSVLETFKAEIN